MVYWYRSFSALYVGSVCLSVNVNCRKTTEWISMSFVVVGWVGSRICWMDGGADHPTVRGCCLGWIWGVGPRGRLEQT